MTIDELRRNLHEWEEFVARHDWSCEKCSPFTVADMQALLEHIDSLIAERDAAIEAIIPVCCRCRHFYKKSRGVYSCRRSGEMEQVYSWDNNEMPCDDFEWENLCEKNTDAPTGAEGEGR